MRGGDEGKAAMDKNTRGAVVVCGPDAGRSFWQPVPANGYAEVKVSPRDGPGVRGFSAGVQTIAPGGHVREHAHGSEAELLFFFAGTGRVEVDGEAHPVAPGAMLYLGPGARHRIVNEGADELKMTWMLTPGGLEDFFEAIGRPRAPGEAAPAPFPRPENVAEIERATVFAPGAGD